MEKIIIGDIFVGDYPITQYFGLNQAYYKKFNLKGHNGLDFALPMLTPVLAGVDGVILRIRLDHDGYGLFVQVWDKTQNVVLLFAHLNNVFVKEGESVSKFQVIGCSGNTGNSTGPHLHFGVCVVDAGGVKVDPNNGYAGYIDPLNLKRIIWKLRDPQGIFANHFAR